MAEKPESPDEPRSDTPDNVDEFVPNRRERRGAKSKETSSHRDGKPSSSRRMQGATPNPRQYTTRRRGG